MRAIVYEIIGHAGYLNRTGSTFGLEYLLKRLMPELRDLDCKVDIIGCGDLNLDLVTHLSGWDKRRIKMRGWVEDLESEMRSADAYLLLNNCGPYRAAFTRHIVAWASRACLIVHSNSHFAIPELQHRENCLMASDPKEMAELIREVCVDRELNQRIRDGGYATYDKYFRPSRIAAELIELTRSTL